MRFSLAGLRKWYATAHLISMDNPVFCTIKPLLATTEEELAGRCTAASSLRNKLDDVQAAIRSFDTGLAQVCERERAIQERERLAVKTQAEAQARYTSWMDPKDDKPAFSKDLRLAFSFQRPSIPQARAAKPVKRKLFYEAYNSFREKCSDLYAARSSFKDSLSVNADSLVVCYQDVVETIRKFVSLFAEWQQSIAGTLNASGAKLLCSTNTVSSATLAGRFLGVLQEESDSISLGMSICHIMPLQNEYSHLRHHLKIFGFSFSQYLCPREAQLVVELFKALLFQAGTAFERRGHVWIVAQELLQAKCDIEKTWGMNPDEDKPFIQSLGSWKCTELAEQLLESFPEPILDPAEVSKYSLQCSSPRELLGPVGIPHIDKMHLLAVASVHGCPQGEILQTIHSHIISHPYQGPLRTVWFHRLCYLLTRKEGWLQEHFEVLINQYYDYVALLSSKSVVRRPLGLGTPSHSGDRLSTFLS